MMCVEFIKNSFLADSSELMGVCVISPYCAKKKFDSHFLDMMYVEFMKNFFPADSSELIGVRVISASWAQKRLITSFQTWCTSSSSKIFFSPIRANWWVLESFLPNEPKNVWLPLSRHDVRRVHQKFFSRRFEWTDGCLCHFALLSQKKVWFPRSRHDVRRVHEKLFSRRFERTDGC